MDGKKFDSLKTWHGSILLETLMVYNTLPALEHDGHWIGADYQSTIQQYVH